MTQSIDRAGVKKGNIIMEYVYFVSTVAAAGLIIFLSWKYGTGRKPQQLSKAGMAAAPPLKKTISGVSEREQEELGLEGKLDAWQRNFYVKRGLIKAADEEQPLSGQKYTFTPRSATRTLPKRSARFEMLPD